MPEDIERVGSKPEVAEQPRWWSTGFAVRLGVTLVVACIIVGGLLGPGSLLLNQLEAAWAGVSLWYPGWMYWQAAWTAIVPGAIIAGSSSFAAVLRRQRPTSGGVLRRLTVGPVVAGALLAVLSLSFPGWGTLRVLAMTAIAAGIFVVAGMLAGLTKIEQEQRPTGE